MGAQAFRIASLSDVSTGAVKRSTANVVVVDPLSNRDAIRSAVGAAILAVGNADPVHATEQARKRWKSAKPSVIWLFVYANESDIAGVAWRCRVLWYSPLLEASLRPAPLGAGERHGTLEIDWAD